MSPKSSWQHRTPQRLSRKESSHTVEKGQEFRMVHFPDRPLKRVSYRDIPIEADCRRILLDWKTEKMKPPIVRSRRTSRDLEKESEYMSRMRLEVERRECQQNYENQSLRRDIQAKLALNPTSGQMAEYGNTYRSPPAPEYVSQQTLLPRTTYNPECMMKTAQSLQDVSHSPMSPHKYATPSTQSSTVRPQSPTLPPFTCPLCRSHSRHNQDGLCNSCKAEFTISCSNFCEDDESILHSSACFPHAKHLARKARCDYSSSVYSLNTSPITNSKLSVSPVFLDDADDPILSVLPSSIRGDASAQVSNTSGPVTYPNQNRRATVEKEQLDLYDLDWAEFYFDEDNFALNNGTREEL
ncbi:hypothetical protein GGI35DRAFT_169683 [Trichoderma velutinum]